VAGQSEAQSALGRLRLIFCVQAAYRANSGTFAVASEFAAHAHEHGKETPMNWDRIEGNWKQFKGQVRQQWGNLTNHDLDIIEGRRIELSGRLQERYGMAKDEADRQIDEWLRPMH
jgi:uncharacterized protein YjbJ (UPF0337 family)